MRSVAIAMLATTVACADDRCPPDRECSPGPSGFTLGGSVVDLVGTLVIENHAGDSLELTGDGQFAFPTVLADGDAYTVSVAAQPAALTCAVANGVGSIAGAAVTDIEVRCGVSANATIACSTNTECSKATQFCCFDRGVGSGVCQDEGTTCDTQRIECDSTADCGGGDALCCARYSQSELIGVTCTSESKCDGEREQWCDPNDGEDACASGRSCSGIAKTPNPGYSICE